MVQIHRRLKAFQLFPDSLVIVGGDHGRNPASMQESLFVFQQRLDLLDG